MAYIRHNIWDRCIQEHDIVTTYGKLVKLRKEEIIYVPTYFVIVI